MSKNHQGISRNGFSQKKSRDLSSFFMLTKFPAENSEQEQKSSRGFGLKTKATLYSIALSVIPVIVVGASIHNIIDQSLSKEIVLAKQSQADALAMDINEFINSRQKELEILANRDFLNWDKNDTFNKTEKELRLNDWLEKADIYTDIALFDMNGNVILKTTSETILNQKEQDYFQKALQTRSFAISQSVHQKNNLVTAQIYFTVPIKDNATGEVVNIMRASIPVKSLTQAIQAKDVGNNQYYLLDRSGRIFFSNDNAQVGKSAEWVFPNWDTLANSSQITTRTLRNSKTQNQAITTIVPNPIKVDGDWKFILTQDTDIALATSNDILTKILLSSVVTMLVAAAIATLVAKRMLVRLTTANMAVENLAQGNLDTRMKLQGQDEITSLSANINEMAAQLQRLMGDRAREAEQLKQFTQSLLAIRQATNREDLLRITSDELVSVLGVERVTIYACNPDGSYEIVGESLQTGVRSLRSQPVSDDISDCTRVFAVENIIEAGYGRELVKQLQKMQVRARIIAPIVEDKQASENKRNRYSVSSLEVTPVAIAVDMCTTERNWSNQEIDFIRQVAVQLGLTLERIDFQRKTQALKNLAVNLSGSWRSDDIYNLAVQDIRLALNADRVVIYQFDEHWNGTFLAESVVAGITCTMGYSLNDSCLEKYVEKYRRGRVVAINDIYNAGLSSCYIQQLETFGVKSNLIAPILVGDELLGLLIAHQCQRKRIWQIGEIDIFEQFARMVGLALQRANLLQSTADARDIAEAIAQQRSEENERVQAQMLELIDSIEGAIAGDLTSRAQVGVGEMGTIADFFNAIIESLQILVVDVKNTATQVNQAINHNAIAIQNVSGNACQQAKETKGMLDILATMRKEVKTTSRSAAQAIKVTSKISQTANTNNQVIGSAIAFMTDLGNELEDNRHKTEVLCESVQQIQRIISSINQIAMQTNLLAINTGIEAARTGEKANPSLTILTQEVANLASRCAGATSEIDTIIQSIYRHNSEIEEMIEQGIERTNHSSHTLETTQGELQKIGQICQQIDDFVQSISTSMVEAVKQSHQVSQTINAMVEVSANTSQSTRKIADELQQTVQLSEQLQANIQNFKVD